MGAADQPGRPSTSKNTPVTIGFKMASQDSGCTPSARGSIISPSKASKAKEFKGISMVENFGSPYEEFDVLNEANHTREGENHEIIGFGRLKQSEESSKRSPQPPFKGLSKDPILNQLRLFNTKQLQGIVRCDNLR